MFSVFGTEKLTIYNSRAVVFDIEIYNNKVSWKLHKKQFPNIFQYPSIKAPYQILIKFSELNITKLLIFLKRSSLHKLLGTVSFIKTN